MKVPKSVDDVISNVIEREGQQTGPVAGDPGGATNWGITFQKLKDVWAKRGKGEPTLADLYALTAEAAREIYRDEFVTEPGYDKLFSGVLLDLVVDAAVNHGERRVNKWIQGSLGVETDGKIGVITKAAIKAADPRVLFADVLASRIEFFGHLEGHVEGDEKFAEGWNARAASFVREKVAEDVGAKASAPKAVNAPAA